MAAFSPNTVIQLLRAFQFQTNAQLTQLSMQFGLPDTRSAGGIEKRITVIMQHLLDQPDLRGPEDGPIVVELAEHLFESRCGGAGWGGRDPHELFPGLINALRLDGYVVEGLALRRALPEIVPLADADDDVTRLLSEFGFDIAAGHLQQAIAAHTRGDWAASNSQLRSFIEELFDRIADRLSQGDTNNLPSSNARRAWLATCDPPFFDSTLNEWDANGNGFVQGFWRRLHPEGPHPGLSSEEDSTFRLHLVIIVAQHFLTRLKARPGNPPG